MKLGIAEGDQICTDLTDKNTTMEVQGRGYLSKTELEQCKTKYERAFVIGGELVTAGKALDSLVKVKPGDKKGKK